MSDSENIRRLVVAIIDFLESQLSTRNDLSLEDRDSLEIAMECLILAYDIENTDYTQRRSLLDMFTQVSNPVSIQNKSQAETLKTSGNAKMLQEQYFDAEEDYTRAIELDKWNAVYYCNRADARIKTAQYFEAIADCRQALLLNPDYAKAHSRMGQAYALMNRPRHAARCFRQAVDLEPDNERYRNNLRVAEGQAAEQPNTEMETLLQTIFASLLGGPAMPRRRPSPAFMIIGDPHTENECRFHQSGVDEPHGTHSSGTHQSDNDEENSNHKEDEPSSERSDEDEPIHLTVTLGIPFLSDEGRSGADSPLEHFRLDEQEKTGQKETQNKAEVKRENSLKNEIIEKDESSKNRDDISSKSLDRSLHKEEQEKSKKVSEKSSLQKSKQGTHDFVFGNAGDLTTNETNQSVKKDLGTQQQNRNNTKTSGKGTQNFLFGIPNSSTSNKIKQSQEKLKNAEKVLQDAKNSLIRKVDKSQTDKVIVSDKKVNEKEPNISGDEPKPFSDPHEIKVEKQTDHHNLDKTEEKAQSNTSQKDNIFKNPEKENKENQKGPSIINMSDIAKFFRNLSSTDRDNKDKNNEKKLKQSTQVNKEKNNENKDNHTQENAPPAPAKQDDKMQLSEKKPLAEKEHKPQEEKTPEPNHKQEVGENSEVKNKSETDEEEKKE